MDDEVDLRDLVRRAAAGEPDAWEALYRRAYPRLFAYARRRLVSDEAADDAVSEAMVRAIDRMPSFTALDPDDREVLELRVVGRLSAEEVGDVLGRRAGAVRMMQSRALGRLRIRFKEVTSGA